MADVDFDSALPVWDNGGTLTVDGLVGVSGTVIVDGSGHTQPVSGSVGVSGTVIVDGSGHTQPVSGTVAVSGVSGTVIVDGSGHTQPVSGTVAVSGTVIVDGAGYTQPVSGTIAVSSVGGTVTVDGAGYTQPIRGTVSVSGTVIVDGSGHTQPVSGTVAVSNFDVILDGPTLAAGATVLQSAALAFGFDGAAGDWQRLKTDGNGALLTTVVGSNANNPVNGHFIFSGGGTGLGVNAQAYAEYNPTPNPFYLTEVWGSASGKMKLEMYEGSSGATLIASIQGMTRLLTGFNSTSNPNIDKHFNNDAPVTTGNSIYLVVTNKDNQYQDLYAQIGGWSPLP